MVFFFSFFILKERERSTREGIIKKQKTLIYATNSTDSELLRLVTHWLVYEYPAELVCTCKNDTRFFLGGGVIVNRAVVALLYDVISAENWFSENLNFLQDLRKSQWTWGYGVAYTTRIIEIKY